MKKALELMGIGTIILLILMTFGSIIVIAEPDGPPPSDPGPGAGTGHWVLRWIKTVHQGIECEGWFWIWIVDEDFVGPVKIPKPVDWMYAEFY